jgi:DeoR/GlpR family transcriptional regulator of sugar metabolism
MRFEKNFFTGAGLSAEFGVSNGTHETVIFQRTVAENSRKNIALFPNQKIGFNAFIKVVDAVNLDILITDWDTSEDELTKLKDLGVEVIIADKT